VKSVAMSNNFGSGGNKGGKGVSSNDGHGKTGGLTRYQRQLKGKQGQSSVRLQGQLERVTGRREGADRAKLRTDGDDIDSKFGFDRFKEV
jgi:hypothetical protein